MYMQMKYFRVDTNVFAFDLTTEDMDGLWNWLQTAMVKNRKLRAVLVEPSTGKPGFSHKGLGIKVGCTSEIDGLCLKSRRAPTPQKRDT